MKISLMLLENRLLQRQRPIIKTLFGRLKQTMRLEHRRHRSASNELVQIGSCLAACILTRKPIAMR